MNLKTILFIIWTAGGLPAIAGAVIAFPHLTPLFAVGVWAGYAAGTMTLAYVAIGNH